VRRYGLCLGFKFLLVGIAEPVLPPFRRLKLLKGIGVWSGDAAEKIPL
jgi:hypothetical protein